MKIAIVDDIAAERTLLNDRLSRQLHGRNIQTDILEFNSGEEFLNAALKTMKEEYGSINQFMIKGLNISMQQKEDFKQKVLE